MPSGGRREVPWPLVAAVVVLLAGHLVAGLRPALSRIDRDFGNGFVAARAAAHGRVLDRAYERDWFLSEALPFPELGLVSFVPHPPANALLLVPLAGLAPRTAKVAWTLTLTACLVLSFVVIRALGSLSAWHLGLVFLLPTAALANALAYGQPYPLLVLCFCVSLLALERGWPVAAGAALAPAVVLKLYGLPFLVYFLWTRRWRAAASLVVATVVLTGVGVAVLGAEVHRSFLVEVLPWALRGEIQDPYSPIWGSATSLAHRLFRFESDLNPAPLVDLPPLAAFLARGVPIAILLIGVAAAPRGTDARSVRRGWAALMVASLAASPLTASYHFVLLVLPVALLWAEEPVRWGARASALLALLAFATSPAPHYGMRWAHGLGSLLAYTRLYAVLVLLGLAVAAFASRRTLAAAVAVGVLGGLTALPTPAEEAWTRVPAARGYLAGSPLDCGLEQGWVAVAGDRLVVETSEGRRLFGAGPSVGVRCEGRRVAARPAVAPSNRDAVGKLRVDTEGRDAALRLTRAGEPPTVLAQGRYRRPRLSPDGLWVVAESWEQGSWDVRVFDVATGASSRIAGGPSNEVEPAWTATGDALLFASDRRRGIGSTALYTVPFRR